MLISKLPQIADDESLDCFCNENSDFIPVVLPVPYDGTLSPTDSTGDICSRSINRSWPVVSRFFLLGFVTGAAGIP